MALSDHTDHGANADFAAGYAAALADVDRAAFHYQQVSPFDQGDTSFQQGALWLKQTITAIREGRCCALDHPRKSESNADADAA